MPFERFAFKVSSYLKSITTYGHLRTLFTSFRKKCCGEHVWAVCRRKRGIGKLFFLGGLWAWHICVTNWRCVHLKSQFPIFDSFRDTRVHTYDFLKFVGGLWTFKWAWPHPNAHKPPKPVAPITEMY